MMQTKYGISKQVNILLFYSTHKFYDPYEFHVYHSLHFNLLLSCGCRIVTLVVQRLAAIRNGMAFMPTFGRTSGCIYSWRCTVKDIGPDTKEHTVSKGSEVRTESSVAQRSDGGAASGCCSASAGGCVYKWGKQSGAEWGQGLKGESIPWNKNLPSTYCFQWFGFFSLLICRVSNIFDSNPTYFSAWIYFAVSSLGESYVLVSMWCKHLQDREVEDPWTF